MLILLAMPQESQAQTKGAKYASPVLVPAGTMFVNATDSTYFAISRLMLERLVVKAKLADTLEFFVKNLAKDNDKLAQSAKSIEQSRDFWRTLALGSTAVIVAEIAIMIIIKR